MYWASVGRPGKEGEGGRERKVEVEAGESLSIELDHRAGACVRGRRTKLDFRTVDGRNKRRRRGDGAGSAHARR